MPSRLLPVVLCAISVFCNVCIAAAESFDESVVRVIVKRRPPNPFQPWTKGSATEAAATAFVIEGNRLLTNAHVIYYATEIYVQPNKSAEKYVAKVAAVAPELDLAVLSLDDATFFEGRAALPFEIDSPKPNGPVRVYGYPIGGEQLSVTEGIISRVDFGQLAANGLGLRIQIDAAINPGNSGGPAISNGKLVGVAFQNLPKAENIGYLIATEEVVSFLEDVKDGHYDGKTWLRGDYQPLENEALRARFGLAKGIGGIMLTRAERGIPLEPLKIGDVITHIGDYALDQSGNVNASEALRLPFNYLVPKLARDQRLKVTILRDGQSLNLDVPTLGRTPELLAPLRGDYPPYFILGPLVFSTASSDFARLLGGQWAGGLAARNSPIISRLGDTPAFEGEELVVVCSTMFAHKITKGYGQPFAAVVSTINGARVHNLAHLVTLVRDAKDEFLEIEFVDRGVGRLVFRRTELLASTEEILADNGIRRFCSEDLSAIWNGKRE